jgi:type I site-specific restriction-modification system R (restriction) subunit
VIIDEVHSSQTGETSKHLKKTISKGENGEEEDEELPDYEDLEFDGFKIFLYHFSGFGGLREKTIYGYGYQKILYSV